MLRCACKHLCVIIGVLRMSGPGPAQLIVGHRAGLKASELLLCVFLQ